MIYEEKGRLPRIEEEKFYRKNPFHFSVFSFVFLPLFCSLLCRNSAATFPYYLVFSCHNLLPFEVCFAGNNHPTGAAGAMPPPPPKFPKKKKFKGEKKK